MCWQPAGVTSGAQQNVVQEVAGAVDDEAGSRDQHEQVRRRLHAPAPGSGPSSQARKHEDERPHRGAKHQERRQAAHEAGGGEAEDRDRGQERDRSRATHCDEASPEEVVAKPGRAPQRELPEPAPGADQGGPQRQPANSPRQVEQRDRDQGRARSDLEPAEAWSNQDLDLHAEDRDDQAEGQDHCDGAKRRRGSWVTSGASAAAQEGRQRRERAGIEG